MPQENVQRICQRAVQLLCVKNSFAMMYKNIKKINARICDEKFWPEPMLKIYAELSAKKRVVRKHFRKIVKDNTKPIMGKKGVNCNIKGMCRKIAFKQKSKSREGFCAKL